MGSEIKHILRKSLAKLGMRAGSRICAAVSGGADSVALLHLLAKERATSGSDGIGIVLSAVHVHHGIRGAEADRDADFVRALGAALGVPVSVFEVDTPLRMREHRETVEEAARTLRYEVFSNLLQAGESEAVVTAHTLEDQAETVLMKFLRGAWTEGLGGIYPAVALGPRGQVLRPMLEVRRGEIEQYLHGIGQAWCTDATNADLELTRNRIRHELMPVLRSYNPAIDTQMGQLASLARDEEAWWQTWLAQIVPQVVLPGKPVRGGGRAVSTSPGERSLAVDLERLRALDPARSLAVASTSGSSPAAASGTAQVAAGAPWTRRLLRAAAARLGVSLDFQQTERLRELCGPAGAGPAVRPGKMDLPGGLRAERTARELHLRIHVGHASGNATGASEAQPTGYLLPVPGQVDAPDFGLRFTAVFTADTGTGPAALVRSWRAGDRVTLRHSRGPKKIKEVLERLRVHIGTPDTEDRRSWPVVEWQGTIVWMKGAVLEPAGIVVEAAPLMVDPLPSVVSP